MSAGIQVQQQGRQANSNGRAFEDIISQRLRSKGYLQHLVLPEVFEHPFFVRQLRGRFTSIYGKPMYVDFFIWHPDKYPAGLIIECKYQDENGSVDEKFPYTIACLRQAGVPAVLLLIGKGAKRCAVEWCVQQQDDRLTVFTTFEAFLSKANRELL